MHPRQFLSDSLIATATERGGVVHLDELRADGISRHALHRLRRNELCALGTGWFALGQPSWAGYLFAAAALAGDQGFACGPTAAALHGLVPERLPIVFCCPGSGPRSRDWVRFARTTTNDRLVNDALIPARCSVEDAVLDCATGSHDAVIALLTGVLQGQRTTPDRLLARLGARARHPHREFITDVLRDAAGVESVLEHYYATDVERAHGLPTMTRQFVVVETGHRSDGAYLLQRRLVELDGAAWHDPAADRALDNLHASLGWSTLRFGWADVRFTPCLTAQTVSRSIGLRRLPKRCPRCRPIGGSSMPLVDEMRRASGDRSTDDVWTGADLAHEGSRTPFGVTDVALGPFVINPLAA